MWDVMESCLLLLLFCLPAVSANLGHLDKKTASYIFIAIAVVYFSFTGILLLLAFFWWVKIRCKHVKRGPKHSASEPAQNQPAQASTLGSEPPPLAGPPQTSLPRQHKRLDRLRSDEVSLMGASSQSSSQTDVGSRSRPASGIRRTPDSRKKAHKTAGSGSPKDHPVQPVPHPSFPTVVPPIQKSPDIRRKAKASDHAVSSLATQQRAASTSPTTHGQIDMQLLPVGTASLSSSPKSSPQPGRKLDPKPSKMNYLDTSFTIVNPAFTEMDEVKALKFQKELKPVAQYWREIGKQLEIPALTLKDIQKVYGRNHEQCLAKVFQQWAEINPNPTWAEVMAALRAKDLAVFTGSVADKIQSQYCPAAGHKSMASSSVSTPSHSPVPSDNSITLL